VINVLPLTIEGLVAMLLLVTILYCVRLNGQLKRLRADEAAMKEVIADLSMATDRAERAIAGLKATVSEADKNLGERLRVAERVYVDVAKQTEAGADLLNRLMQISGVRAALKGEGAAPPEAKPAAPDAKSIMAAAQAFAERARARIKDRAA
jgi:hypothetical protein